MPDFKRIKIKKISRVALCEHGANLVRGLYKSADGGSFTITPLVKSSLDDQGLLHAIVYSPDMVDDHGHFMSAEDVRAACHSFAVSGMDLDLNHGQTALEKSKVRVVENMILSGASARFPSTDNKGRKINHDGAWAVVVQFSDEELRKQAKEGKLAEVSLYAAAGDYSLEAVAEHDLPSHLKKATTKVMDQKELEAALQKHAEALTKSIGESIAKALEPLKPKEEKKEEKKEVFDATDPVALAKMAFSAEMNSIYEEFEVDASNPQAAISKFSAETLKKYTEAVTEARERHGLSKSKKSASQPGTGNKSGSTAPQTWEEAFGNEPLLKATKERLKRTSNLN